MIEFVKEINKLDGGWLVILTSVMVMLTFFSVLASVCLTWISFVNQRAGLRPNCVAYMRPGVRSFGAIELVIANVGPGAAKELAIDLKLNSSVAADELDKKPPILPGQNGALKFAALPAHEDIVIPPGMSWELMSEPNWWPMELSLNFKDIFNRTQKTSSFSLNLMDMKGLRKLGDSAENDAADALKKIADILKRVTGSGKQLKVDSLVATVSQHQEIQNRQLQEIKKAAKKGQND